MEVPYQEYKKEKVERELIYLDYSANTPADAAVLETFLKTEKAYTGNPNSSHPLGIKAREEMARVTDSIAALLGVLPTEIIYTSGASEANNTAVKGLAAAGKSRGRHIISTPLEHPSVSGPLEWLQKQGYKVNLLELREDGRVDLEHLRTLIGDDTCLVAVTAVDSELGIIQPVKEISEIVREHENCRLHVDATQAMGKIPFSFEWADTVSLAAHKFYGLNGTGLLYRRQGVSLEPLIHGADVASYRSGTPTLGLAAALEKALEKAFADLDERYLRVKALNHRLREGLSKYPAIRINSPEAGIPHILNLSAEGIKGTRMQQLLAERGICVSVKSACSADGAPSKAVLALTGDRRNALSSWRISLSHMTEEQELDALLSALGEILG